MEALALVDPAGAQQRQKMEMTWLLADCQCSSSLRYLTLSTSNLDYLRDALSPKSKWPVADSNNRVTVDETAKTRMLCLYFCLQVHQHEADVFRGLSPHIIGFSMIKPAYPLCVLWQSLREKCRTTLQLVYAYKRWQAVLLSSSFRTISCSRMPVDLQLFKIDIIV